MMEWFYYGSDFIFTAVKVWFSFQVLSLAEPRWERKTENIVKGMAILGLAGINVYNDIIYVQGTVSSLAYLIWASIISIQGAVLYRTYLGSAFQVISCLWAVSALFDFFVMLVFYVFFEGSGIWADMLLHEGGPRGVYLLVMSAGLMWIVSTFGSRTKDSILMKSLIKQQPFWKNCVYIPVLWICVFYFQRIYWEMVSERFLLNWLLFLMVFFFVGIGLTVYDMMQREKAQGQLINMKLEMIEMGYLDLLKTQKEKAVFFHDVKNHMITVANLLEEGEEKVAQQYVQQIVGEFQKGENRVWANHSILDLILNEKRREAYAHQISMEIECDDMSALTLSSVDICTLCSNILDNAIEANLRQEERQRWMRFSCKRQKAMVIFSLDNPTDRELNLKDGIPETTKADKRKHGFGMYSIQKVLDRNGGHMDFYTEGNIFHITIGVMSFESVQKTDCG